MSLPPRRFRAAAFAVAAALLTTGVTLAGTPTSATGTPPAAPQAIDVATDGEHASPWDKSQGSQQRPNIILITTDDQTITDMAWMPQTRKQLAREGITFSRALSPHPLCCPARAAILTGQYAQNNGVKSNKEPFDFTALDNKNTLAVWLNRAGYRTAFTGKYLNGFGTKGKPQPGWDYWDATMFGQYAYVNYKMYQNGNQQVYRKLNNVDYINRRVTTLIKQWAPSQKPFFIWASHVGPHGRIDKTRNIPSTSVAYPPTRFKDMFKSVDSPSLRDQGYLNDRVSDKNYLIKSRNIPSRQKVNQTFRSRIRTLQGVDEGVTKIVNTLRQQGDLGNTYIIFTSDNGYLVGEHHIITKNLPYRQSIRVPMFMRGPGIPKNTVRSQRALMIDVAPTIAALAQAKPTVKMDGTSLLPTLTDNAAVRDTVLIQAGPHKARDYPYGWFWRGVTTDRYTYARFFADGTEELYDHQFDPSEIDNVASDPAYAPVLQELRRRTLALVTCAGLDECSADFGPEPLPLTN